MTQEEKQKLFKLALGNYPTGVTIVTTTASDGTPVGLTANSFASVSLDPLLILWSIDHRVSSLKSFTQCEKFAVHILADNQAELCKTFATRDVDRFGMCEWSTSEHNLPVLEGALAVLQCKLHQAVEAGDHTILIGEVLDIEVNCDCEPLLYHRRNFGRIPDEFYMVKN